MLKINSQNKTADETFNALLSTQPNRSMLAAIKHVQRIIPWVKRQIDNDNLFAPWQSALLYCLAIQYNRRGGAILEIGTAQGYSAAIMAEAATEARLTTLNPKDSEWTKARENLQDWRNATVLKVKSWDYFDQSDQHYDLIFVDGDHGQVERDLVFWERVKPGGLFLFHDYAAEGSARPCQPVYEAVNGFAARLGREPDVLVVDDRGVGIAGFYKERE